MFNVVHHASPEGHYYSLRMSNGERITVGPLASALNERGHRRIARAILEHLPARSVVVFSTNTIEKLSARFRDRCECLHFRSAEDDLRPSIVDLCKRVWAAEGCRGPIPGIDRIGLPSSGEDAHGHASFRLALRQLERLVREYRAGATPERLAEVQQQLASDWLVASECDCDCPACGKVLRVRTGAKSITCPHCSAVAELQLA
jgi:hypothetical protein